jgi:hypothetical protein
MASKITGKISFTNERVAQNVEVRVFDKDSPGKGDDDLTIDPGLSDSHGIFTVQYDPGRYVDFANIPVLNLRRPSIRGDVSGSGLRLPNLMDIYSPYLQFSYTIDGQARTYTTQIALFQGHYLLPETAPIQFKPSQDGFRFFNWFSGFILPFSIPFINSKVDSHYGLCGGMSAAAYDFLLAGRKAPETEEVPKAGTIFQRYLFRRSIDSFAMGESILQFARWMALPDLGPNGTCALTLGEYQKIRDELDQQRLVPLGLIYDKGKSPQDIAQNVWNNHQVLAYGYAENADSSVDVRIYDPNEPKNDDVTLHAEKVQVGESAGEALYGLTTIEKGKKLTIPVDPPVYGFFRMPYQPVEPPASL